MVMPLGLAWGGDQAWGGPPPKGASVHRTGTRTSRGLCPWYEYRTSIASGTVLELHYKRYCTKDNPVGVRVTNLRVETYRPTVLSGDGETYSTVGDSGPRGPR